MKCILSIGMLLLLFSCSGRESYKPEAIALNEKAIGFMHRHESDSALVLFDKAIAVDKRYYLPHSSKAGIYISRKQYAMALIESELAIEKKPDFAEGWTTAGILHEITGDPFTAMHYYERSAALFKKRVNDVTQQHQLRANRLNHAVALMLSGREAQSKDEIIQLVLENPGDNILEQFLDIDKHKFIIMFVNGF
jgi:tetratricopeptide (TPR) repeat protein